MAYLNKTPFNYDGLQRKKKLESAQTLEDQRHKFIAWMQKQKFTSERIQQELVTHDKLVEHRYTSADQGPKQRQARLFTHITCPYKRSEVCLTGTHIAVREKLMRTSAQLFLVNADHAVHGTVLAIGDRVDDVSPGDEIIYEEYQGGRWVFDGENEPAQDRFLIMDVAHVLLRVEA